MLRFTLCTAALVAVVFTAGCADLGDVKPWQKANLAKPAMTMGGSNPLEDRYEEHIALSKEGSSGGTSVGGGGCGCN